MASYLQIRTTKFPILEGEELELVNPGTYGKSFALYLQKRLIAKGYSCPFVCCEDWGWWVELKLPDKTIGLCCYRHHDENTECDFVCAPSLEFNRVWSWRKFRMIDLAAHLDRLILDLITTFEGDPEIEFVGTSNEFPF